MSEIRNLGLSPADVAYRDQVAAFCDDWDAELVASITRTGELIEQLDAALAGHDAGEILRASLAIRDAEQETALRRIGMLSTAVALLREATS